ncbi:CDP-glycerol glycerophosphotransferase family protein [Sphingomonas psychrotolerans]|uniref:CDP-glycerol glycerophosphotransferase family protein n=1 Tax=Sphingomonas psychrotolerans TaxID=1327635 RepID=A0ABU3N027_9SPHN|nr:hypothetical protein [Sphingomonas psychrotolerans]MDT8757909.1 CDP-glycerol glycerophosphotransferase family protein [Sphingomonas psychrotolerans]
MRVLFYLPVITPYWFNDSVSHLIRSAAQQHEVHVIVPPLWSGTGIGQAELQRCADLTEVHWHIIGSADHPSYRTRPEDPDALVAFVETIDPDYTICRSADVETPARFPGRIAYLMEAEFAPTLFGPVPIGGRLQITWPDFFAFGMMPSLSEAERTWLLEVTSARWRELGNATDAADRQRALAELGIPPDRKIISLPLQCQRRDNFFGQVHGLQESPDAFVARIAAALGPDYLLAVSLHPIDLRDAIRTPALDRIAQMDPERVRIAAVAAESERGSVTDTLIRYADALVVAESKSIMIAALHGKPILRVSSHPTAPWVRAYDDPEAFAAALRDGSAAAPAPEDALVYYGYHYANNAFVAAETSFEEVIARTDRPHDPGRWKRALGVASGD